MQVLGQDVEVGDIIKFPSMARGTQPYWAPVTRMVGMRAYNEFSAHVVLTVDVHVGLLSPGTFARIKTGI